ncbi:hypothetical protein CONLIGDRAFT_684376 [Coniochaeta ligniaria NRRL 30616]|uniref:Uncharacterized protein n=1 Tax=Coniochaeta ligniaria NRRL 30616 TaxID=1408157 RepID=A0A1J7IEF2_9PEZI|nr:hypothetical protein CONLIGDRAFT_684376 [Coniochaeta ligniaria NRRL 30616]
MSSARPQSTAMMPPPPSPATAMARQLFTDAFNAAFPDCFDDDDDIEWGEEAADANAADPMDRLYKVLDIVLRQMPYFLAEMPPDMFEETVGFPRCMLGYDFVDPCLILRDIRVAPGAAIYTRRKEQHKIAGKMARHRKQRVARARAQGRVIPPRENQPSPLNQMWNQNTIMDEYDNTDPWTPVPGESAVRWNLLGQVSPTSTPRKRKTEDEDEAGRPSKKRRDSPEVAYVGGAVNPYLSPPPSHTKPPPLKPHSPQLKPDPTRIKRKGSEDVDENPTKRRRDSPTEHEPNEQGLSPPSPHSNLPPLSPHSPQHDSTLPPKKRKADGELDEKPTKKQCDSLGLIKQVISAEAVSLSSGTKPEGLVNTISPLNSSTLDKQHGEQGVGQLSSPALTGPFTDAPPTRSSLANIHHPAPSLTAAHPPSTDLSPANSFRDNQQIGKASPSQIWFRRGWSCNLH